MNIGFEKEIRELYVCLNRKITNNVLLTGKSGVGKTHVVKTLAIMYNIIIISLPVSQFIQDTSYRGEFEKRANELLEIITKYQLVCFIDEIHTIINIGRVDGAGVDLNNLMKPLITNNKVKLIGATTPDELYLLNKDKAFRRRFNTIEIKEMSKKELLNHYEKFFEIVLKEYSLSKEQAKILYMTKFMSKKKILNKLSKDKLDHFPNKLINFFDKSIANYIHL